MSASACDCETTLSVSVPAAYREHAPASTIDICTRCLRVEPVEERERDPDGDPELSSVSDAVPARPERAVPLFLAIDLSSSLAINRDAIESLLEDVERAGTDPLLTIDRLLADPSVEPAVDLERRRHQLEQLL
ncbi:DUF6276 family protein [Natronococcus jeotgali]|uniref:Uncharacterized protein n=1 Tax=Natronococcus jeotgali DSM 18795 TaxID=1227498 RepID=L9XUG3_9EURY|nr:DUF6276 family protein [Natronococcus jeotgali]ELY65449.1 hypothetical protein C492_04011 [Natronococcus jeotgali DSM 18795]